MVLGVACLQLEGAQFADTSTAKEEVDDLLQTEGDDEADADGDEADEHCESAP